MKYLIFACCLCCMVACDNGPKAEDQWIQNIESDGIQFYDGFKLGIDFNDKEKIYYLFRHAEKDSVPKSDPNLTELGMKRANKIADIFRKTRVDQIRSTMFMRTILSVDSLARTKGMQIKPYDHRKLKAFAMEMEQDTINRTHVIVGHSNSTPGLVKYLGKQDTIYRIEEDEYDNFFVVTKDKKGNMETHKLQFKP